MAKLSLSSLNKSVLEGKKVLVRVDFNVPLDDSGLITDDTRIRAAIPTIKYLVDNSAKVILAAHFGRPKGKVNEKMRLTPVAERLSSIISKKVVLSNSCIGDDALSLSNKLDNGDIMLLENVRFYAEEEKNCLLYTSDAADDP